MKSYLTIALVVSAAILGLPCRSSAQSYNVPPQYYQGIPRSAIGLASNSVPAAPTPLQRIPGESYALAPVVDSDSTLPTCPENYGGPIYDNCEHAEEVVDSPPCGDCGDCKSCNSTGGSGGVLGSLFGSVHGDNRFGACRPSRFWFDTEYLLLWTEERFLPALVTTSPPGTLQAEAGVLGFQDSSILFGDDKFEDNPVSGYRIHGGYWLDSQQTLGVGVRYFSLDDNSVDYSVASGGDPILGRPFLNTDLNQEDALLVAFPGLSTGSININATNEISGGDIYVRRLLYSGCGNRVDFVGGYQYSQIDDKVTVRNSLTSVDPAGRVPVNTVIGTRDEFDATNQFHGGSLGLMAEAEDGRLFWRAMAKVAFGNVRHKVAIRGQTVTDGPTLPPVTDNFGLLALGSNIGDYQQDEYGVIPEARITLGYKLSNSTQLTIGYSVIYWSQVVLAGEAIDTAINPTQLTGALVGDARPRFNFTDTSFWAQGLNFGVNVRF